MVALILGSTSRFRRALLDRIGLSYDVKAPQFEENPPAGLEPLQVARLFATEKARSIPAESGQWVIGCDQVAEIDGRILRKTTTLDECRAQLYELSGNTHALHSAVALWSPSENKILEEMITVKLTMRALDRSIIDRYVELEKPMSSAGGYFFEGRGIGLFEEISGGDDSAIVGLPLMSLCRLLRQAGIEPFGP